MQQQMQMDNRLGNKEEFLLFLLCGAAEKAILACYYLFLQKQKFVVVVITNLLLVHQYSNINKQATLTLGGTDLIDCSLSLSLSLLV